MNHQYIVYNIQTLKWKTRNIEFHLSLNLSRSPTPYWQSPLTVSPLHLSLPLSSTIHSTWWKQGNRGWNGEESKSCHRPWTSMNNVYSSIVITDKEKMCLLWTFLVKAAVPEFQSSALLGPNRRDIFFSPYGDRTGTAVLTSAHFTPSVEFRTVVNVE